MNTWEMERALPLHSSPGYLDGEDPHRKASSQVDWRHLDYACESEPTKTGAEAEIPPFSIASCRSSIGSLPIAGITKLQCSRSLSRTSPNSLSPVTPWSTGQSSFFSTASPPDQVKCYSTSQQAACSKVISPCLTPIKENDCVSDSEITTLSPVAFTASVATVEKAAAIKTFFEVFYEEILSRKWSPRTIRRKDLERCLQKLPISERMWYREEWIVAERSNTREDRVFKTKSLNRRTNKTAGIEWQAIRVLGKGSFGMVNLVADRHRAESNVATTSSARSSTNNDA